MKRIICPIDFSETSLLAVQYATEIADFHGAQLTIIHAVHLPALEGNKVPLSERVQKNNWIEQENSTMEVVEAIDTKFKRRGSFASVDYEVKEGLLVDIIVNMEKKGGIDLIVMGTLGASGLGDYLIGSNTSRVVKKVKSPVLLVPFESTCKRLNKIVYGSNLDESEISAIKEVVNFAKKQKAMLKIVHIGNPNSKIVENRLAEFEEFVKKNVSYERMSMHIEFNKDEFIGLNKFLKREKADLLAIHNRKRNFISKLFDSSLADEFIFHSDVPVLCLN
ncbi:MAG: hypothetical protein EA412_13330 [Chitinophagaceae bacterium]|nr:MAG: hypothetical protein EA412_13330 [Chitinophagaceae bacterium]